MEEVKISKFKHFGAKLKPASLLDCITSTECKDEVLTLRKVEDKTLRDKLKSRIWLFTPSALLNKFSDDGLIKHSGFICTDFDGKDNPHINDWQDFIRLLGTISFIAFAGLSVSGKGAFALVPIKYPDKHKEHYQALEKEFENIATIDKQCSNVSRARYYSYNEKPYLNFYADVFDRYIENQVSLNSGYNVSRNIEMLLNKIIEGNINITSKREDWIALSYAFRRIDGGREIFHKLSSFDVRYDFSESDRLFTYAEKTHGFYDERKFFEICKRHGIYLKNSFVNNKK